MDFFPTMLSSIGVELSGDRLGLGTDLFSSKETLMEIYGSDYVNEELNKKSSYYDANFFNGRLHEIETIRLKIVCIITLD